MNIVIAGSMSLTKDQSAHAHAVIQHQLQKAQNSELTVIVGDNPQGVDAIVRAVCWSNNIRCECWAANRFMRANLSAYRKIVPVYCNIKDCTGWELYRKRDHAMIMKADQGIFLSNGQLTYNNGRVTGTKHGYDYMQQLGKPAQWIVLI
jgi:hypothetical protein